MPYNMFPYTDLSDTNFDWLLKDMRDAAAGSKDAQERVKAMESLLRVSSVQNIVRAILDEMNANGQLGNDVLSAIGNFHAFNTYDHGWSLLAAFDRLVMAKRLTKTFVFHNFLGGLRSDAMVIPLDMPVDRDHTSFNINVEAYNTYGVNVDINSAGTRASFQLLTNNTNLIDGNDALIACQCNVTGRHKTLPTTPSNPSNDPSMTAEVIDVADSYYQQANLNWGYGHNFVTNANNTTVINDGKLMMECDAFVAMVMLGVDFANSPYNAGVSTFDFDNLVVNPNGYSWPLAWANDSVLNRKVTWTGGQNWWLWDNGCVFSRQSSAESGDIVIFQKPGANTMFDYISHIGIISKESGVLWVYHFTGSGLAPGSHMKKEKLEDIKTRESYPDDHVYFARPVYVLPPEPPEPEEP